MEFAEVLANCELSDDCPTCSAQESCPVGKGLCNSKGCLECEHKEECPTFALTSPEEKLE